MSTSCDFLSDPKKLKFHHGLPDLDSAYGQFLKMEQAHWRHSKIEIFIKARAIKYGERDGTRTAYLSRLPYSNITFQSHSPNSLVAAIQRFTKKNIKDELSENPNWGLSSARKIGYYWYKNL